MSQFLHVKSMEKRLILSFRNKTREAKDSIKVVMSGEN